MSKTSVKIGELSVFLIALSQIKEESLRAKAAAEAGKCVQTIRRNHLRGSVAKVEARKMATNIAKCPFCEVKKGDLEIIIMIEGFIARNFS
jgi:hypothetical protein